MKIVVSILLVLSFVPAPVAAQTSLPQNATYADVAKLPRPRADLRVNYGPGPLQFGELRLPRGKGPHPVAIIIHGGCWQDKYDLGHLASLAEAITRLGVATWVVEYRRLGSEGGGWPGTFEDVARASDFLKTLAREHPLDLKRVVAVGHSAGGHLALWLAAGGRLAGGITPRPENSLRLRGVVSLAGITDLSAAGTGCGGAASELLGGPRAELPERYALTSPVELLPTSVPQRLVHGARDRIVPVGMAREYEAALKRKGGEVELLVLEDAGHFELVMPGSTAWPAVSAALLSLLRKSGRRSGGGRGGK